MKVSTIVNIIYVHNQYQKRIKDDYSYLEYCKSTGSKFKIQEARERLDKDKKELGEFLDYEV